MSAETTPRTSTTAGRLLAAGLPLLALAGCTGDGPSEGIRSYDIAIEAAADGSLLVEETIDYDFAGEERHGIVRVLPDRAPFEQTRDRRYPVGDIAVDSPTAAPEEIEVTSEDGALTIRVGDPDEEIEGRHTYVLTYRLAGVADPGEEVDRLAWNAVGTGWEVPIDEVTVRLTGPADAISGDCVTGEEGERTPCAAEVDARGEVTASADGLAAGEGVTVSARYPSGTFPDARPVYEDTFSPALAFSPAPAAIALGLAGLLAVAGPPVLRARRARARASGPVAPQLTPPHDARPAQLGTVLDGHAQRHEVTATMLDLAVRGFLRIEELPPDADDEGAAEDWRLVRGAPPHGLRPYEQRLLDAFFADGDAVVLSGLQERFAGIESDVCAELYRDVVQLGWFREDPAAMRRRWYAIGAVALLAGIALTVVLALTSTWALAGLGVVVGGLVVLALAGRMPRRTQEGTAVLERVRAFRDHLASDDPRWPAGHGRIDDVAEAARGDARVRYLPYAVALGVAADWAERLAQAPRPDWYVSSSAGMPVWPALLAFSSSSNPALAPPVAAGSAGSASVGGAAGGGGGGSW
ncbi:DUF2207 domain-containing protein [Blastococcus haudaquaticus]|uniref:TIGR04222 domain-containing protein n=1 Tax=Blastococcus haudaquaticus TaxID=1938745 RepID=A0A286GRF9_9ACTN|nr:DUF2207 domain-containing protein [Blastococcus haudaquaticus]SOD98082.1 TIGR04222 domain-containing protein [Blastococcus haudaquaticus]